MLSGLGTLSSSCLQATWATWKQQEMVNSDMLLTVYQDNVNFKYIPQPTSHPAGLVVCRLKIEDFSKPTQVAAFCILGLDHDVYIFVNITYHH